MRCIFLMWLALTAAGAFAQDSLKTLSNVPFVLGRTVKVKSELLKEDRTLNIYLPEGYNPSDSVKYPVIYLLDGSADEDFIHVTGLVQFMTFPWIDLMPASIIVGIANVDRQRDFTYPTSIAADKKDFPTTGGSEQFIAFLEKELQPYIQRNFKADTVRTLVGQSLGGLLATEILIKKPFLFSNYIIVSPSLWWDHTSILSGGFHILNQPTRVFLAVGAEGDIMEKCARQLFTDLEKRKDKNLRVQFEYFPDKNHGDIYHQALYKAFESARK